MKEFSMEQSTAPNLEAEANGILSWLKSTIKNIKVKKNLQGKSNGRNVAALLTLKDLDFPLKNIRKALVVLNGISLKDIAGDQVSVPSVSNTINANRGKRGNTEAQQLISDALGVQVRDLFDQPSV